MFKRPESAIATLLDDVNEAKRQIGELGYTLSRLEAEVFVRSAELLRLGEEVWMHGGRSLKDEVNEQHIRIAHLEAVMTRQAKPPPGNTPLAREPTWPPWDLVCQRDLGGGCGGVGPYKAPPTELLPSAAAQKQPPPKKAPPQMSPKLQLVAPREGSPGMEPGHGGADRDLNIMSNLSLLPSMPDGRPDPWDCPPPPPAGGGARAPPATPAKKAQPAVWLPGPSPAMKAPPQEESMPPHIGRKAPPPMPLGFGRPAMKHRLVLVMRCHHLELRRHHLVMWRHG